MLMRRLSFTLRLGLTCSLSFRLRLVLRLMLRLVLRLVLRLMLKLMLPGPEPYQRVCVPPYMPVYPLPCMAPVPTCVFTFAPASRNAVTAS